jgi:hypothetical protein
VLLLYAVAREVEHAKTIGSSSPGFHTAGIRTGRRAFQEGQQFLHSCALRNASGARSWK